MLNPPSSAKTIIDGRIVGPKPNGRLWPTIVKFTTPTLEVWIEQVSRDDLAGLFDRTGFAP